MAVGKLKVEISKRSSKSDVKVIRNKGKVPGVYYFKGNKPVLIEADYKELYDTVVSKQHLINLKYGDGEEHLCIFREVQRDPVSEMIVHFDLLGIEEGKEIELSIPVELIGEAAGISAGGMLEHSIKELWIRCLPKNIPEKVEVDVSKLEVGDAIHVEDLTIENVEIMEDPKRTVAHVIMPRMTIELIEAEKEAAELAAEEEVLEAEEGEEPEKEELEEEKSEES